MTNKMVELRITTLVKHILYFGFFSLMLLAITVQAEGGFGVSGTFAGYHYKLVPGEQINSENVYASFVNNYSVEIDVQLLFEAPPGVEFNIANPIVTIPAGQSIRVPVGIRTTQEAVPGDYVVRVFAQVLPGQTQGITLVGSAGLNARLSIFGEAGRVTIRSLTSSGDSFDATIELFRIEEDGRLFSVATAENRLTDRLIVGNYVVRSYFQGRTIGEQFFTLNNNDNLQIDLIARTVFIRSFTVEPNFFEDRNILSSTTIAYSLENIYLVINNIKLDLVIKLDGEIVETQEMFLVPVLNPGQTEGRFTFIPRRGWQAGTYEISIRLYEVDARFEDGQFLYDETNAYLFEVPESIVEGGLNLLQVVLLVIAGGLFVLLLTIGYMLVKQQGYFQKSRPKA
jgi:hypothetical protein